MKEWIKECERALRPLYERLDEIALFNQKKVLDAFRNNKLAIRHFAPSTGYGYGDEGRDVLNRIMADIFRAEAAVLSPNIVSGTHALALGLYAILRPGDVFLSITGTPYDTLIDVIDGKGNGSLKDFGISFETIPLKNGGFDFEAIEAHLAFRQPKMIYLQRSRGYEWRSALNISQIGQAVRRIRKTGYTGCIMLDNCYGEFVEEQEPLEAGVDLVAGSMIKNPGAGIAPTGGYLAGKKEYIELVQNRMTAPSIGGEVGSYAFTYQYYYEGLFLAPHVVKEALKGSLLFGKVFSKIGYDTSPAPDEIPGDIIRAIRFGDREKLIGFIQTVQAVSPVDSYVDVLPWAMPGYESEVIMAAGCFVQGSSIELSADAPVKEPFIAYLQGGLTYEHCKIALESILERFEKKV